MKIEKEESSSVRIYNDIDFKGLKKAGNLAAKTLEYIEKLIRPGVKTDFIDQAANKYLNDHGAFSAPLFYRGYTKSICTSINHV
ncbi:MAG: type I methionyl aminopeptidase, partial [Candidatus Fonsibacter lacus]